jgi:putative proteasome-type protease
MTYCLAIKVDSGIVFASDSRTNAGVDHVDAYSKMHSFTVPGERAFVLLSAGNLATTQAVLNILRRDFDDRHSIRSLSTVDYVFDAAQYVGEVSCNVQTRHCESTRKSSVNLGASFILGGQIAGKPHDIFLIYPEGNYISPSPSNPYLQIGETKYGKPILDRIITHGTTLEVAGRCALVSLDSTMRSNVSVGPPIELALYRKDGLDIERHVTLDADSEYSLALREAWSDGLNRVFEGLPRFDWE